MAKYPKTETETTSPEAATAEMPMTAESEAKDSAQTVTPEIPATTATSTPVTPLYVPQLGLFGKRASGGEGKTELRALADATHTSAAVYAALKAAYGWSDTTRLKRSEFLAKREAWLSRPATEG